MKLPKYTESPTRNIGSLAGVFVHAANHTPSAGPALESKPSADAGSIAGGPSGMGS